MSTQILPTGEIILTNERGMIGAGYDYGLRAGPPGNPTFDSGSFGLPISNIRRLRFDHCFILTPESVAWLPTDDELIAFFHFLLTKETGEVVTDVVKGFAGDPKYTIEHMVHYVNGHSGIYNIPAEAEKTPNGRYELTCTVNSQLVNCAPVRFFLEIFGEDIWMYAPPIRFNQFLIPFRDGVVDREDLNPAAPPPKPA